MVIEGSVLITDPVQEQEMTLEEEQTGKNSLLSTSSEAQWVQGGEIIEYSVSIESAWSRGKSKSTCMKIRERSKYSVQRYRTGALQRLSQRRRR